MSLYLAASFSSVLVPGRILVKDKLTGGVYLEAGVIFSGLNPSSPI